MKEYVTLGPNVTQAETVIEKSRFIATCKHVESVEEAVAFVDSIKKQYFDATHNCYAYVCGDRMKFSDDGEPQGTAGMPMLECVRNTGLDFVCVVVTRYFGGIKLGAGGLVRAYSGAVANVLAKAERVEMLDCTRMNVTVDYNLLSVLRKAVLPHAKEVNVTFDSSVTVELLFPSEKYNTICDIVTQNTLGKAKTEVVERLVCRYEAK